jgi:hypothetical protein
MVEDGSTGSNRLLYQRRSDAVWRVGGRFAAVAGADGRIVTIEGPAVDVWMRLAEPCTFDELVRELACDYGVHADTVRADVAPLLAELQHEGFVSTDG